MPPVTPEHQQESNNFISSTEEIPANVRDFISVEEILTAGDLFTENSEGEPEDLTNAEAKNSVRINYLPNTKTEQFVMAAFENAFIGVAILDVKGHIIQSNQAFSQVTGISREKLSGEIFFSIIHPDDLNLTTEAWGHLIKKEKTSATIESRFQNKIVETVWARNSFSLITDHDGTPGDVMVVCVNINEEKRALLKAEEVTKRFRFLADSMPQQIWTADVNGNLNYFSHSFYEDSGMTFEDIKGSNWENIVLPEDRENTNFLWRHSMQTGEEFVVEHRLKRRDGNYTWQLSKAMAQKDSHGKIVMWVGSISNIHRQKTVEEELEKQVLERTHDLQQANFNLKHSNHDLEQFAYIATHDLQEPLRKIRTYSSWINKKHVDQLPQEAQEYMLKIENASERMSVLIDDLLNYSLLLRPQEKSETTDLNIILKKVLTDFEPVIKEKKAVIHSSNLPELKVIPMQIHQLFHNLVSNSLKFASTEREPVIFIRSRIISDEEIIALSLDIDLSYVEISFKDNGIGFLQEYAKKIFSIFQRLNNRNKYPGTGIGLAFCQKIMEFHHGLIYATSDETDGASFYALFPF